MARSDPDGLKRAPRAVGVVRQRQRQPGGGRAVSLLHPSVGAPEMVLFLFLVVALVIVVAAVTLAAVGRGESGVLPEAAPERFADPLPADRPVDRDDVESLRFPMAVRGYRMADVDDALGRLGAELAERDARIAQLESALAGARTPGPPGVHRLQEPDEPQDAGWDEPRDARWTEDER